MHRGTLGPAMGQRPTLRDVAQLAGVHPATASRALNDETRRLVREATLRRVEQAARTLRYRPDHLARSLKTGRSSTIGVLVPDITNPLFPPILRGIEDRLARRGYVSLVGNTDNDDERERLVLEGMRARYVDGLVVATARRSHERLVELATPDLPIVLVNRVVEGHLLPSVSVDDQAGIRSAVSHLVALGHRRIAHLAGPQQLSTGFGRYEGFRAGVAAQGMAADEELVVFADAFSEAEGYRCARILLERRTGATAVVAGNDMLALGCLRALAEANLACPSAISLVGFNDMPFMDRITPPLTTVRVPHYETGAEAAELLLERLASADGPAKTVLLPPQLVVRASTGPPPGRSRR